MDLIHKILKDLKWFYGFQEILWILRNNWKNIITHSLSQNINKDSFIYFTFFFTGELEKERERRREGAGGERWRDSQILKEKNNPKKSHVFMKDFFMLKFH